MRSSSLGINYSLVVLSFLFLVSPIFAYVSPGQPVGFVNDYVGLMNSSEQQILNTKLKQFAQQTGNEIVVAIVPTLQGDTIENFAVKLFEEWKIGKERYDNGLLMLISKDDRAMRVEVGYGLEGFVTDAESNKIIKTILAPTFQIGDFYTGLNESTTRIMALVSGEATAETTAGSVEKPQAYSLSVVSILFIINFIRHILGRSKSWWMGGVLGGIAGGIVGWIYGFVYVGAIALAALIPFGLLLDFLASRAAGGSGGDSGWRGRSPWIGGGGSGGGGFGGFGGGRSGGGGASGRW